MTPDEKHRLRLDCLGAGYSVITGSIRDSTNVEVRVMAKGRPVDEALRARIEAAGWSVEK